MVLYTIMDQGVNCVLDLISQPLPDSVQQRRAAPVLVDAMDAVSTALEAATPTRQLPSVPASIVSVVSHPCCNNGDILKRIPKGARSAAANLLSKLIRDVLQHPLSTPSGSKLLGFPSACLAKPSRGGKSRNLTTQIFKQISQYDQGVAELPSESISFNHPHRTNPPEKKTHDEAIARLASVKFEDGDVKGAVRLLCSDDRLAFPDESTFDDLRRLHPTASSRSSAGAYNQYSTAPSLTVCGPCGHTVIPEWFSGWPRRSSATAP